MNVHLLVFEVDIGHAKVADFTDSSTVSDGKEKHGVLSWPVFLTRL
jgi:hypothetical protein